MGRLGEWDKVEKRQRPIKFSRGDEIWEYVKMSLIIIGGLTYLYFLFVP